MTLEAFGAHVHEGIEISESGSALVLRIVGDLDHENRDSVERSVLGAIELFGSVVIDLDELTFCDSHGVALFLAAKEKARGQGTALEFRNLLPPIQRVFEITDRRIKPIE